MRSAEISRQTRETQIGLRLDLDGSGESQIDLPLGFLSHMLDLLVKHSLVDLKVSAAGDLGVDDHHLTEDLGIGLGQAIREALGDKRGIRRYGFFILPMDEVLCQVALDLGGRYAFASDYRPQREQVGDLSTEMVNHFFASLANQAGMNLHIRLLDSGENEHHRVEAIFKCFARALRAALEPDPRLGQEIPSTKGTLC
ncbi:MAG TPA: imidazoleglycerol-phosphate dehydratase HisB [Acidobacteriota bacterium]|nr:imidazoleglycerol-phosphate dehydratase HisB [Acidobacteriota bacterium]